MAWSVPLEVEGSKVSGSSSEVRVLRAEGREVLVVLKAWAERAGLLTASRRAESINYRDTNRDR